ncbi:MAG TPA: hypothetical protein VMT61_04615 [Candidatus Binataceae bacterium]|nr:hypothetical protein [Candidatus Binataceae bacterium]
MANPGDKAPPTLTPEERAKKAEEAFIRGLIARGEAAKADEHGNLPPGATHEIIGTSPSGLPIVVRRRFYGAKTPPKKSD